MNLKQQFYRGYYDEFDPRQYSNEDLQGEIKERNKRKFQGNNERIHGFKPARTDDRQTLNSQWYAPGQDAVESVPGFHSIELVTTYPGLLVGTGYNHETNTEDEITLGFSFDHVTGLPVIPGTSLKGIIRSAFPRNGLVKRRGSTAIPEAKANFIRLCLRAAGLADFPTENGWVDDLESAIFASPLVKRQDVFFDAVIASGAPAGSIVGPDFITPHSATGLQEPTPLRLLKVLPEVGFTFRFLLFDSTVGEVTVTAAHKLALFNYILLANGVGAKANVGYGRLVDPTGVADLSFLETDLAVKTVPAAIREVEPTVRPQPPADLPELADNEIAWTNATSLAKIGGNYAINGLVIKWKDKRTLKIQLLITGLIRKNKISGRPEKWVAYADLAVNDDEPIATGYWIEVLTNRFNGTGANAHDFSIDQERFKLIAKRKK